MVLLNKALFLDRDGVINVEKNYLHTIEAFEFIEGIFALCRFFQAKGYQIIVVTNQSGIARGYYTEEDFNGLTAWMIDAFNHEDVKITAVYHCPHHPDISGECACRKPEPGMLLEAAKAYDIDLKSSLMIGDKERDIEAALRAGVKETYLYVPAGVEVPTKASHVITSLEAVMERYENH